MPGISIRPALATDAVDISALIQSLLHYRAENPPAPPSPQFLSQFAPETLARCMTAGNHRYMVACDEACGLIGVLGIRDNRHLLHLFVAESHQRRGIARALWLESRAALLAEEPAVEMTVRSSVFATEVYLRFGFVPVGPRVDLPEISFIPMRLQLSRPG